MAIDNALKNPVVTSVLAVKSGDDFVAVGETSNPLPVTTYPNTKTSAIESSVIGKLYKAWELLLQLLQNTVQYKFGSN